MRGDGWAGRQCGTRKREFGKAGRKRWMGKMPHNRGVSMNPVDHPHGGGEGKTSGGRHPVTRGSADARIQDAQQQADRQVDCDS